MSQPVGNKPSAAFYAISADSVLARFLCISRASCYFRHLYM